MRLVLLFVLGGLMHAARSFAPGQGLGAGPAGVALAVGYLFLTGLLAGSLFSSIGLPRLTGYLAAGIAIGPQALGFLPETTIARLQIFNGAAVSLIALSAGSEMHLRSMRPLLRTIGWITAVAVLGTACFLGLAIYLAREQLPFTTDLSRLQAACLAMVLAVTMVAQSPAVVVALRDETQADGPLTHTVLGVVVLADLVVILLFAITSSFAKASLGGDADLMEASRILASETVGSLLAGVAFGLLIALYLRKVPGGGALFVLSAAFVAAEVGQRLRLDPLLLSLAAGLAIRNLTRVAERLQTEIEAAAVPVYVAFFAIAGATIHLDALGALGLPALAVVAIRAIGLLAGTRAATSLAGAPEVVRRFAGFGLLPQAGLALALAVLFARTFPEFGADAASLVFAVVALNEILAPVLYRWAIMRSGEAGRRGAQAVGPDPTCSSVQSELPYRAT
jgi:Kef-type K+ transport system membrane component KefB